MSNEQHYAQRRQLSTGWLVGLGSAAAAVVGLVIGGGSAATGWGLYEALHHAPSQVTSSQSGSSFGDLGSLGGLGGDGSSGNGTSSGGYGYGDSGATSSATTATAAQQRGVVIINTELAYQQAQAAGTGVVLTSDGEILTNNHVVEGSTSITVTVASTGQTYEARVVGTDATDDVAVLQLTDASGLTVATLDSDDAGDEVGAGVTAVGNAGGTGTLVAAAGTVTATDQTITTQAESSVDSETLHGLIETNADIEAGDSGGPLLDANGEVVGIDTAASSNTAVTQGYAIPIDSALSIAEQIESGRPSSTITIGYPAFLGVEVSSDAAAYSRGVGSAYRDSGGTVGTATSGATVGQVIEGTPAASAGLTAGDTIAAIDGTAIGSADALTAALAGHKPGDSVTIAWVDASGAAHSATVTLAEGPAA
jgi:S1-C subfamily serine protease